MARSSTRLVGRPVGSSASNSTFNYGDPVLSTMIGWHAGNWHWKVAAAVNIPAGAYQPGEFSNLALNRWLGDFSGAITYPDALASTSRPPPATVNGESPDTDYGTGKELHFEAGVTKHLTKELSVGLIGAEPGGICVLGSARPSSGSPRLRVWLAAFHGSKAIDHGDATLVTQNLRDGVDLVGVLA